MSELGKIGIVEEMPCGRIRQIGLTADQKRMLELSLVPIAKMTSANALVGMPPDQDLILKRDANQWIDVNERLPSDDGKYLTLYKGFTYNMGNENDLEPHVGYWNGGRGCFDEDYDNALFTHWMPLPEPPIK